MHRRYITGAQEVTVGPASADKKAIIIWVPFKLLKQFNKIQIRLVRELEKKFSGSHVLIVAQRKILGNSYARSCKTKGPRPRSRTLTAVHDAILDDLVYPTEIVGKRTTCKVDGTKELKVMLEWKEKVNVDTKLETFTDVYKRLTNKDVVFEFPVDEP
jgi:small subunit ribosomal protein S7e